MTAVVEAGAPRITEEDVKIMVKRLYGMTVGELERLASYDDINYHVICEEHVNSPGFVFKVINASDSCAPGYQDFLDAQDETMSLLRNNGYACPELVKTVGGSTRSLETISRDVNGESQTFGPYFVRMLTYIPGHVLRDVPITVCLLLGIGEWLAEFHNCTKGFHHAGFSSLSTKWRISRLSDIRGVFHLFSCEEDREMMEDILSTFYKKIRQCDGHLTKGVIHGDMHKENILVSKGDDSGSRDICAVLDFGDMQEDILVFDLGIAIMYTMLDADDTSRCDVGGYVLAGYTRKRQLNTEEWNILETVVCARVAQSICIAMEKVADSSDNLDYIMADHEAKWNLLRWIRACPKNFLSSRWSEMVKMVTSLSVEPYLPCE